MHNIWSVVWNDLHIFLSVPKFKQIIPPSPPFFVSYNVLKCWYFWIMWIRRCTVLCEKAQWGLRFSNWWVRRIIFWGVMPCSVVKIYQCVGHICLHLIEIIGIVTRYRLDCPGIESRWGRDFPQPSRPSLGPLRLLYNGYRVSFPGVKQPERSSPTPSSAEVKERVELYLYSPSEPSWPVLGWTLPLPFNYRGIFNG
jgi:hypothetical protein